MTGRVTSVLAMVGMALLTVASCDAAPQVEPGAKAPDFSGVGVDDREHQLSDYKDAKALVVVFTCNHCPVAKAYEDRLIELQNDYESKGVQVVAICVNDRDGDRLPGMKKRAEEKGFNFPYVYDETQESARQYGATCTPHAFLLGQQRTIAYQGAIDDNNSPDKVEERFLRDAIDAVLAGNDVAEPVTRQRGCGIKWSKK
jgi:peroxiredoxin